MTSTTVYVDIGVGISVLTYLSYYSCGDRFLTALLTGDVVILKLEQYYPLKIQSNHFKVLIQCE